MMFSDTPYIERTLSQPSSPSGVLVVLPHIDEPEELVRPTAAWRPILSDSDQVVLYNSDSHALSVRPHSAIHSSAPLGNCPYCHRPLDLTADAPPFYEHVQSEHTRASNYFQLLEIANETISRPSSPGRSGSRSNVSEDGHGFRADAMAEGYFKAFFKEEYRLGMGANGSVYLCQHVLDGNPLGHFAVKKIAVGESHSYLLKILREVRLLERLRHPNIITYHHSWLETHQFSSFGPKVPTLFVLMQWGEGGSLDDFIEARLGRPHKSSPHSDPPSDTGSLGADAVRSRAERIRAFRAAQARPAEERERQRAERAHGVRTAVHLLSAEEVKHLFTDVAAGLAFLHDRAILHLDLKPGNVLLTWEDETLIPRAMLSDFGTSRDMIQPVRHRSGNTGTLEYTAPESLRAPGTGLLTQIDSKADMWSLGMILHMLLFFRLPYRFSSGGEGRGGNRDGNGNGRSRTRDEVDADALEREVLEYLGFKRTHALATAFEGRGLPTAYLFLLESLLHKSPKKRPSSEQVLRAIREGNLDPLPMTAGEDIGEGILVARMPSPPGHIDERNSTLTIDGSFEADGHPHNYAPTESGVADLPPSPSPQYELDTKQEIPPLLALPSPTDTITAGFMPPLPETPMHYLIRPLLMLWADFWRWTTLSRPFLIRGLKSVLLVLKILMLLSICPNSRPEPVFACFILGVAVGDTWSEDLWLTVLLAILHVVILRLHCSNSNCCV